PDSRLIGGGTDLMVNIRRGIVAPPVLIDVNNVEELRTIRADAETLEIGAAGTLAELAAHPQVGARYPGVAQAAGSIAGPTHREMGTLGGNLCLDTRCLFYNQSEWWRSANHHCLKTTGDICHVAPKSRGVCFATFSGDLAPALLTLDAEVDLAGPDGRRTPALAALYIRYSRQDQPATQTLGGGQYFLPRRPGRFGPAAPRRECGGPGSGQEPHPRLDRVSGGRRGGGANPRGRHARRSARRLHRHQSAAGTARRHRRAVRRRARSARVRGPRRAGARPDHVDEDHVYAPPLPPPRRRRAGAAAAGAALRGGERRRADRRIRAGLSIRPFQPHAARQRRIRDAGRHRLP